MIDDSNCHCPTCTTMNEPLTLEGDIRYLKAHIESKDRQLADANLRIDLYKEAWQDAERAAAKLDEKNALLFARITELEEDLVQQQQLSMLRYNDNMGLGRENQQLREELERSKPSLGVNLGLQQENERLKVELEASQGQVRGQLGIILDLRKEKETLVNDRTSLVDEANELYERLERIATIVDEIME